MNGVAVLAGSISTSLFVVSALPMLYKAACTRDLSSYSLGNLVLAASGMDRISYLHVASVAPDATCI